MTTKEKQAEFELLYTDQLPWSAYINVLAMHCERLKVAGLTPREYAKLDALLSDLLVVARTLTGKVGGALDDNQRAYVAGITLSRLLSTFGSAHEAEAFHGSFFSSDVFQKSGSTYQSVSVDLWKRYEQAQIPVPSEELLALNQPGHLSNMENGSDAFRDAIAAELYSRLGESGRAGDWYAKLPTALLGPVKAADAYYAAKDYEKAKHWYTATLKDLGNWEARKAELSGAAVRYPLQDADFKAIRERASNRLQAIQAR